MPLDTRTLAWEPPSLIAGELGGLRRALKGQTIRVHAPALDDDSARRMVEELGGIWVGRGEHSLDGVLGADSLPLRRVAGSSTAPRYRIPDSLLAARWNAGDRVSGDAQRVVFVDLEPIDAGAWASLPQYALGSCEPAFERLAAGQEHALAYVEPFLDYADAELERSYRRGAEAVLPRLHEAVRAEQSSSGPRHDECRRQARARIESAGCGANRPCDAAPRMIVRGRARVVVPASDVVDVDCAAALGVDVEAEIREMTTRSVDAVTAGWDPGWSRLVDRLAAIDGIYDAVLDVCRPRRRRLSRAAELELRARYDRVLRRLAEPVASDARGRWSPADGRYEFGGLGAVRAVAVYDGAPGSAAARAAAGASALREFVFANTRCSVEPDGVPAAVLVVDSESDRVVHLGYHYLEELVCDELGPRQPESTDRRDRQDTSRPSGDTLRSKPASPRASAPRR